MKTLTIRKKETIQEYFALDPDQLAELEEIDFPVLEIYFHHDDFLRVYAVGFCLGTAGSIQNQPETEDDLRGVFGFLCGHGIPPDISLVRLDGNEVRGLRRDGTGDFRAYLRKEFSYIEETGDPDVADAYDLEK